jgi:hypothetical protein
VEKECDCCKRTTRDGLHSFVDCGWGTVCTTCAAFVAPIVAEVDQLRLAMVQAEQGE